jgi:hypothetical protein
LKVANLIADRPYIGAGGQLKRWHRCPEAIRAEQRARPVVEEAGGRGTVEQRWAEALQPTITDVECLARVEEEEPVEWDSPLGGHDS